MSEPDKIIRTVLPSRYHNIYGRDLVCPVCAEPPKDVAPNFRLDAAPDDIMPARETTYFWHCTTGHQNATTVKLRENE